MDMHLILLIVSNHPGWLSGLVGMIRLTALVLAWLRLMAHGLFLKESGGKSAISEWMPWRMGEEGVSID